MMLVTIRKSPAPSIRAAIIRARNLVDKLLDEEQPTGMASSAGTGQEIVDQMGFFNDQIPGDLHGLRDEHQRHGVDGEENPFAAEAFFGEDISGVERDHQRESHRQKGGHDAVEEVAGERDAGGFDIGGDVQKIIHGGLLHEKRGG